ncbi:hypothetical protein FTV88_0496 [Heliorestis convoluta]|uniref:Uncharacterized protein n=1 Tax=Heliorestis convoluta TaxID=356322 RepID=A0A5Q2N297_9FIRM|nr:hypothetical protein FTV88_0496 [Heliorestis convoluta]
MFLIHKSSVSFRSSEFLLIKKALRRRRAFIQSLICQDFSILKELAP